MARRIESLEVSIEELEQLVEGAGRAPLSEEGQQKLKAAVSTLGVMAEMLTDQDTTIQKLRELLLPARTSKKTRKVLHPAAAEETKPKPRGASRKKGHGRKGAAAYVSAQNISVAHRCPMSEGQGLSAGPAEESDSHHRAGAGGGHHL